MTVYRAFLIFKTITLAITIGFIIPIQKRHTIVKTGGVYTWTQPPDVAV